MRRIEDITEAIRQYDPKASIDVISKAYVFSAKVHRGQTRLSGEPYMSHPLEVAYTLTMLHMDAVSVAVGLLHDTVEDTFATSEEIKGIFGEEIMQLVDSVTKISKINFASKEEQQAENFRKMILAMSKDLRAILIKLADRTHNVRTLNFMPPDKQKIIARETLDIYAPLANRLGIGWLKQDLEDYSFRYLYPKEYKFIAESIAKGAEERQKFINSTIEIVKEKLGNTGIPVKVKGRSKHYYSVFNKMRQQNISFEEIYDLRGIRLITDTVQSCYSLLGTVHSLWKPVPGKIKDYIALPKANMYQSLHTSVIGPHGERVEFQIRTDDMHRIAEEGIAAHWKYKDKIEDKIKDDKYEQQFLWLRYLLDSHKEVKNPREFLEMVKIDLFPDEVYVFTPKGEVKGFPRGATPIDFAYQIHTDVGHRCCGAKVNGKMVPLHYQLMNGDIVEIMTSPHHEPSRDWLKIVVTAGAKSKIKAWMKVQQRERSTALGKEICEKEIMKYNVFPSEVMKPKCIEKAANYFGFPTADRLMESICYGKVSLKKLMSQIIPEETFKEAERKRESAFHRLVKRVIHKPTLKGVLVKGLDDIMIRFGKCCNPIPGDEIIGFITRGRGVSVHQKRCPSISDLEYDSERRIQIEWDTQANIKRQVQLSIATQDKPGLLAQISNVIASMDVNISKVQTIKAEDNGTIINLSVEIDGLKQLQKIMKDIQKIKGVKDIERLKELKY